MVVTERSIIVTILTLPLPYPNAALHSSNHIPKSRMRHEVMARNHNLGATRLWSDRRPKVGDFDRPMVYKLHSLICAISAIVRDLDGVPVGVLGWCDVGMLGCWDVRVAER